MKQLLKNKKVVLVYVWISTLLIALVGTYARGQNNIDHSVRNAIGYFVIVGCISLIYFSKYRFGKKIFAITLITLGLIGALNLIAGHFFFGLVFLPYICIGSNILKQ